MEDKNTRFLAQTFWIKELKNGVWKDDFLDVSGKDVYRVQLIGTVVQKFKTEDGNYCFLSIDDGSDNIRVKFWREDVLRFDGFVEGDLIRVIGGAKYYNNEIYVSPIVIKKVHPNEWLYHLNFLGNFVETAQSNIVVEDRVIVAPVKESIQVEKVDVSSVDPVNSKRVDLLKLIKMLDAGQGAELDLIVSASGKERSEIIIVLKELMDDGEVYEPAPNRLKVLD